MSSLIYLRVSGLSLLITLASCAAKLDTKGYYNFFSKFKESSYVSEDLNNFTYKLQYRPSEFLALVELKANNDFKEFDSIAEIFNQEKQFCLRIESHRPGDILKLGIKNENEYYNRIELLNSQFNTLIIGITSDGDSIPCGFHHFERTYGVVPYVQVLCSFLTEKEIDRIVFTDLIFNENNKVHFNQLIKYKDQLPNLSL